MLLDNSYNRYLGEFSSQSAPLSGSSLTAVVANSVYTIVSLGTASLAQWQAVGLTPGIVPAVGSTFVASSSGTIGGSAAVQAPLAAGSGIDHIEAIGDPNMTIGNIISNPPKGRGYVVFACFKNGVITQPTDGSTISIAAYFNDSSVLIAGA